MGNCKSSSRDKGPTKSTDTLRQYYAIPIVSDCGMLKGKGELVAVELRWSSTVEDLREELKYALNLDNRSRIQLYIGSDGQWARLKHPDARIAQGVMGKTRDAVLRNGPGSERSPYGYVVDRVADLEETLTSATTLHTKENEVLYGDSTAKYKHLTNALIVEPGDVVTKSVEAVEGDDVSWEFYLEDTSMTFAVTVVSGSEKKNVLNESVSASNSLKGSHLCESDSTITLEWSNLGMLAGRGSLHYRIDVVPKHIASPSYKKREGEQ
eukprot:PhF_6_TR8609/c0_g1_i1/m.13424